MHSFSDTKLLPYKAEFIKKIILDIEKYPEFLPWCSKGELISEIGNELIAILTIDFKIFSEKYKSRIITTESKNNIEIYVEAISGPFKKLINNWNIEKNENNNCKVNFFIDFECKSAILNKAIEKIFPIATNKVINAFEARAQQIFQDNVP